MNSCADIAIGHYYPKIGIKDASGKAIYIRELASALAELSDVVVYSGVTDGGDIACPGAKTTEIPVETNSSVGDLESLVPLLGTDDILSLRVLKEGIRRGVLDHINRNVDVLVTHYYLDDIVLSHLVDVPVIYQYHGLPGVGLGSEVRERVSKTTTHIANSRATAATVTDELGRDIDHIVTPGVDVDRFHPDGDPAFGMDETVITFVGRLAESKGIFDLLDAFSAVSDDAHLCLVGDSEGERGRKVAERIDQRIQELRIEDDVTLFGEVAHEELHRYYAASDIVCYPTYYDGFGLVNIEAMASGTPVVTTNVSGVKAYAVHEENSLLVEPGDTAALQSSLRRLVDSPDLRDRLGAAGRDVAEQYSWRAQAASLLEFCQSENSITPNAAAPPVSGGR